MPLITYSEVVAVKINKRLMQDDLTKAVWIASVQVNTKPKIPWFPKSDFIKKLTNMALFYKKN